jgi:hypothetical protein
MARDKEIAKENAILIGIVLFPFVLFWNSLKYLLEWPFQKKFDEAAWKSTETPENGARYWMVRDLKRKIRGISREGVVQLLGGTHGEASPSIDYFLKRSSAFGNRRYDLRILFDEQGKVKKSKVEVIWEPS